MNIRQKQVLQLQKKARQRRKDQAFIIEGIKMFEELPRERLIYTVVSESFLAKKEQAVLVRGLSYDVVKDAVFEDLSDTKTPQGILAIARQYEYGLEDLLPKDRPPLLLVLETLQDPGNLGTILRAGEAAGVTGILMNETTVDIYSPKVVRSTMGSLYRMPFLITNELPTALHRLQQSGVRLYAASLKGKRSYEEQNYRAPSAFLIGNEANGLSEELEALADERIRIPMSGKAESLNAAIAAAVLSFEAARQRRTKK